VAFTGRHVKFIVKGIEKLDPITSAFGKGDTMPGIFVGTVLARFALSRPSGHVQLRAARLQPWLKKAIFDCVHGAHTSHLVEVENKCLKTL
jgi:hypothetical protein